MAHLRDVVGESGGVGCVQFAADGDDPGVVGGPLGGEPCGGDSTVPRTFQIELFVPYRDIVTPSSRKFVLRITSSCED